MCYIHAHPDYMQFHFDSARSLTNGAVEVKGTVETANGLTGRLARFFRHLELLEKIAEIADEAFHLCLPVFRPLVNTLVHQHLHDLHHAAHAIEHSLHAVCFVGDLVHLTVDYQRGEFLSQHWLLNAARVFHMTGHFFATLSYLSQLGLCSQIPLQTTLKYGAVFSVLGYTAWTLSFIWQRFHGKPLHQFTLNMSVGVTGILFEGIPLLKSVGGLASYGRVADRITSIAGIMHAGCVLQRLTTEKIKFQYNERAIQLLIRKNQDSLK